MLEQRVNIDGEVETIQRYLKHLASSGLTFISIFFKYACRQGSTYILNPDFMTKFRQFI